MLMDVIVVVVAKIVFLTKIKNLMFIITLLIFFNSDINSLFSYLTSNLSVKLLYAYLIRLHPLFPIANQHDFALVIRCVTKRYTKRWYIIMRH